MARILLLDEDSPTRILTRSALRTAGHEIVEVSTAQQAVAHASQEHFDLILVDLFPPDLNGVDLVGQLSLVTGRGETPIVTMADDSRPVDLLATATAGAMDHLRKPCGFKDLDATIDRLLSATPQQVDDLRVIRKHSVDVYRQSIELIETARSAS